MIDELSDRRIPKMSPLGNRKTERGKMVLLNKSVIYIMAKVKLKTQIYTALFMFAF